MIMIIVIIGLYNANKGVVFLIIIEICLLCEGPNGKKLPREKEKLGESRGRRIMEERTKQ